jgi:NADH:ubiquinone oxidoreductase subunit H
MESIISSLRCCKKYLSFEREKNVKFLAMVLLDRATLNDAEIVSSSKVRITLCSTLYVKFIILCYINWKRVTTVKKELEK